MKKHLFTALVLLCLSGCGQWWNVRPYVDFVRAEIKPQDRVKIKTTIGREFEMTITLVQGNEIEGKVDGQPERIRLKDITHLQKYARVPPANPCSPEVPLGCTVPKIVTLGISWQRNIQAFFYPSCEQHDYCYRHGAATYGEDQESCDRQFFESLKNQCKPSSALQAWLRFEVNYLECNSSAVAYYEAVQKRGSTRFSGLGKSTYCEYEGPP